MPRGGRIVASHIMANKSNRAEQLMEEGFEALASHDTKRAMKIARELKKLRHSSNFEIMALARVADGQTEQAVQVLKEGVGTAPTVWRLWQLLGNCYSDLERFQESHASYQRALQCPGADASTLHLNRAIALEREEKHEETIQALSQVSSEELRLRRIAMTMELLNSLGRHSQARILGEEAARIDSPEEEDRASLASIYAGLGRAVWAETQQGDAALGWAWKAVALEKDEATALWLIREADHRHSTSARYMRLLVQGRWHESLTDGEEPPGFYATYEVVADSREEAMEMIRPFEPESVRGSLSVERCDILEKAPGEPKGVYVAAPAYAYFAWKDR
jgi:tetratricopeptide (TPR) repeat protein